MKCIINECKNYLKMAALAEVLAVLLTASPFIAAAQEPPTNPDSPQTEYVQMYIDETPYSGRAVLYEDTTYVDLYEFTEDLYPCAVIRDGDTAVFTGKSLTMQAQAGAEYIVANGRYLWCPDGVFGNEDSMYVPLRVAAKALGAEVSWNAEEFSAYVQTGDSPITPASSFYVEDEVYWLSRIIYAEAGAEPFEGQIAVGNVVLNRTRAEIFPDTIYDVIFDREYGVQFTPTANGMIYCTPDEESIIAAKICLEGYSLSYEILYFINAALASNFWVPQNCDYVMTIQNHDFYS